MIIDYSIANFRSIRDKMTISFVANDDKHLEKYFVVSKGKYRLLKMLSILGANASGKSNVLRAFYMFPEMMLNPCKDKTEIIKYDKFALDSRCEENPTIIEINFLVGDTKYYYEVTFDKQIVYHELLKCHPFDALKEHTVFERNTNKESLLATIKWGEKYRSASNARILLGNLLHNRTVFGAYQNSNVDIPWMKNIVDWVKSYILPTVLPTNNGLCEYVTERIYEGEMKHDDVARELRKADVGISDFLIEEKKIDLNPEMLKLLMKDGAIPDDVKKNLSTVPYRVEKNVKLLHEGMQGTVPFEFKQESNGTQRYYELSGILLEVTKQSRFVTIDELECRLHPDLYQHFIVSYLSNAGESQILFTTHMREFLADRDLFRDDSVWITEKSENGATDLYSIADFDTDTLRATTSRYNSYRAGRLGGIPNLGDTYIESSK